VDLVGMDLAHTMRVTGTHLELRVLQDFCRCAASGVDGDDLVVVSVQDEGGMSIFLRSSVKSVWAKL